MSWLDSYQNFIKDDISRDLEIDLENSKYKYLPIEEHIDCLNLDRNYFISFTWSYNEMLKLCTFQVSGKITLKGRKAKQFSYGGVTPLNEMEKLVKNIINYDVESPFLRLSGYATLKFLRIISYFILYYGT